MQARLKSGALLEINGIEYEVDEEGFLQHDCDWSREVAAGLPKPSGCV